MQSNLVLYSALLEILAGLALAVVFFAGGSKDIDLFLETRIIDIIMILGELFLMGLISFMAWKHKKFFVIPLTVIPTLAISWLELFATPKMNLIETSHIHVDRLSVLMVLIVVIVGGLINIYATGYMKGYHHHHPEIKDRTNFFLPLLMVFLGAMSGLVLSASLIWLCFFWEVTSTISFLLIGYTQTKEAETNSFRAIWMNLLGGMAIVAAVFISVYKCGTYDLFKMLGSDPAAIQFILALLGFAALTKSAQMPFSGWLIGAMCAPTPSSALLHSATMVKAGIYLLIRLAPAMSGTVAGKMVAYVGGFTFLVASMLAISSTDAKKVLAYSTVSNLGLMTACCGIGTMETVFGAIMLMIFHAVSKSMLFQAVGAVENSLGSREIGDWNGLIKRLPKLAVVIIIGILGMYTAPFGMLISKYVAFQAFVDSGSIILVLLVAFGSATTMFYWTKFLATVFSMRVRKPVEDRTLKGEYISLYIHAALVILICALLAVVVNRIVDPMEDAMFATDFTMLTPKDFGIMVCLLIFTFAIPFIAYFLTKNLPEKRVKAYMAGVNTGDGNEFIDAFGNPKDIEINNWYMEGWFGEKVLNKPSYWASSAFIVVMLIIAAIGGTVL